MDRKERALNVRAAVGAARESLLPLLYLTGLAIGLSLVHVELGYVVGAFLIIRGLPVPVLTIKQK